LTEKNGTTGILVALPTDPTKPAERMPSGPIR
jgi:hypothetical protein